MEKHQLLNILECLAVRYCLNTEPAKRKLDKRCKEEKFVRYSDESKGYRVWTPTERKIEISRNVRFLKEIPNTSKKVL